MRLVTPTLSICALAATFTAGALTAAPDRTPTAPTPTPTPTPAAAATTDVDAVITISSYAFSSPAVAPGAAIRVVNQDSAPHTVTAGDGTFDVNVEAGETVTFVAPSVAGSNPYFCSIHPSMSGVLTVA